MALKLFGPSGQSIDIEAIIETGFNGTLVVPDAIAVNLELSLDC